MKSKEIGKSGMKLFNEIYAPNYIYINISVHELKPSKSKRVPPQFISAEHN